MSPDPGARVPGRDGNGGGSRQREDIANARFIARAHRSLSPYLNTLPPGEVKADFLAFLTKHGAPLGIGPTWISRATLLDAKVEVDARYRDEGVSPYDPLSEQQFERIAEGTRLRLEEVRLVAGQSIGRHTSRDVPEARKLTGQSACGYIVGAVYESMAY